MYRQDSVYRQDSMKSVFIRSLLFVKKSLHDITCQSGRTSCILMVNKYGRGKNMKNNEFKRYLYTGLTAVAVIAICIVFWYCIQHWDLSLIHI